MKCRVHLRIAKNRGGRTPFMVQASSTPNYKPLEASGGRVLPTAMFALDLNVPEEAFKHAEQVLAELDIDSEDVELAADVVPQ